MEEEEYEVEALGNPFSHEHTGFCIDPSCPCHEDGELIGEVYGMHQDGLVTNDEATRRVKGWTL